MTGVPARARPLLAAGLLLACLAALLARPAPAARPDCSAPVACVTLAATDAAEAPCLRDPACGGASLAAFAPLAVLAYRVAAPGPSPLAVARRPRRRRGGPRAGNPRPPLRPPTPG